MQLLLVVFVSSGIHTRHLVGITLICCDQRLSSQQPNSSQHPFRASPSSRLQAKSDSIQALTYLFVSKGRTPSVASASHRRFEPTSRHHETPRPSTIPPHCWGVVIPRSGEIPTTRDGPCVAPRRLLPIPAQCCSRSPALVLRCAKWAGASLPDHGVECQASLGAPSSACGVHEVRHARFACITCGEVILTVSLLDPRPIAMLFLPCPICSPKRSSCLLGLQLSIRLVGSSVSLGPPLAVRRASSSTMPVLVRSTLEAPQGAASMP